MDNLYLHDRNPLWLNKVNGAMVWLHDNKRDTNGHYGRFWGREGPQIGALDSWNLIEQAAVARAYLYTSAVPEPGGLGLVGLAIAALLCRRRSVRDAPSPMEKYYRPKEKR